MSSTPNLKSSFGVNEKIQSILPPEKRNLPGPGVYDLPSDFGDWRSNSYVRRSVDARKGDGKKGARTSRYKE